MRKFLQRSDPQTRNVQLSCIAGRARRGLLTDSFDGVFQSQDKVARNFRASLYLIMPDRLVNVAPRPLAQGCGLVCHVGES